MMNRKRPRARSRRARRGVTLIELIVASTILMFGLLSIVGVSAMVSRSLGESRNQSLAATYAQSRFERLAGQQCSTFSLGTVTEQTTSGVTERYVVTDGGNNTRALWDTVTWKTSRNATRRATFRSLIPCRPGA
jgi:Tfp pilus assembly protein PilV